MLVMCAHNLLPPNKNSGSVPAVRGRGGGGGQEGRRRGERGGRDGKGE